jgi:hypothetical protein
MSIMHACLNDTFDAYRDNTFKSSPKVLAIVSDCKFYEVYDKSVICVALMFESLFGAVSDLRVPSEVLSAHQQVVENCTPP